MQTVATAGELRLDLGCGRRKRPGFVGVDLVPGPEVDVVADLDGPLPFDDSSAAEAHCRSTIEHLRDPIGFLNEIHRVLRPGGRLHIFVPHFSNPYFYSDPTHQHTFGLYSFSYVCATVDQPFRRKVPAHYTDRRWRVVEQRLYFEGRSRGGTLALRALGKLVNASEARQEFYERHLAWRLPCYAVAATLEPRK